MDAVTYTFTATLWKYEGKAAWYFLTLPQDQADEIKAHWGHGGRGSSMVRVTATIGASTWQTSVFRDAKAATYHLPIKAAIRKAENLQPGDTTHVTIAIAY